MTKEEAAKNWANERCPGQDSTDIVWCMCYEDFLAGCAYAQDIPQKEQQIIDDALEEYVSESMSAKRLREILSRVVLAIKGLK